jgi:hypothetical protein
MPDSLAIKDPASASNINGTQRPDKFLPNLWSAKFVNTEATQCFFPGKVNQKLPVVTCK